MLQKNYNTQEISMDNWPFWLLEEIIKIVNEITDEENNNNKRQEDSQNSMGNFDADAMIKNAQNMTQNIPKM